MNKKFGFSALFFSGLLAAELAVAADFLSVYHGRALSVPKFGILLGALFLVLQLPCISRRLIKGLSLGVLGTAGLAMAGAWLCWSHVSRDVVYDYADDGKAALYADRKVMLLVPHQDDDINVLGGVLEEYVKYGSEVTVVFSTNGDYLGLAQTRFQEALDALGSIGIDEEHVIFLGYGDQWQPDGLHLYNGQPGQVMTSFYGQTQTYGTQAHGVYREGTDYTIDHFLGDIGDVILEYRPDVLYCVDYDYNIDHRALSLSFEKVMGTLLKENPDYRPQIFKGYAYNTAWEAEKDFYRENLLSVQDIFVEPYLQTPAVYHWAERVRLPVNGESLSRSVLSSRQQETLSCYYSQGANMHGIRIFNSDKVFWQRYADSLCLDGDIGTSSGNGSLLNDFMLLESLDLVGAGYEPYDGVWIPEAGDTQPWLQVTFPEPRTLAQIVLYDHPDPEKNVKNAKILFEDGTEVETGPLHAGGAATRFTVEKQDVTSFTVTVLEMEGEAGLTEIEAFAREPESGLSYIKVMDEGENFAYDYWIDPSGAQSLRLYTCGALPAGEENYVLSCSNDTCTARWEGDRIAVTCPEGERCTVTVTLKDGALSDTVCLSNPGKGERGWKMFWLRAEEALMKLLDEKRIHERLFVCRLAQKLPGILERLG